MQKHEKYPFWRVSGSGPNPRTSGPRIKNYGRVIERYIGFRFYPEFYLTKNKHGIKIGNRQTQSMNFVKYRF
jgi:hypothetical protein